MVFSLRPDKAASNSKPIASARYPLQNLVKAGSDFTRERFPLKHGTGEKGGEAGSILLTTNAIKALNALGSDSGTSTSIMISVGEVTIKDGRLLKEIAPPSRRGGSGGNTLHVIIDMPGAGGDVKSGESTFNTEGIGDVKFEHTFDVGGGTELRRNLARAFDSKSNPQDSEVQLIVMSGQKGSKQIEIGEARISLESLVAKGKEHDGPLNLYEAGGGNKSIGNIMCTVKGLSTLQVLDDEAKGKILLLAPRPLIAARTAAMLSEARVCMRSARRFMTSSSSTRGARRSRRRSGSTSQRSRRNGPSRRRSLLSLARSRRPLTCLTSSLSTSKACRARS